MSLNNIPENWTEQDLTSFKAACDALLIAAYHDEAAAISEGIYDLFLEGVKDENADVIDCIMNFRSWFRENANAFRVDGNIPRSVTVTVSAPAGQGTIAIAFEASLFDGETPLSDAARRVTISGMVKMGMEHLKALKPAAPAQPAQPQTPMSPVERMQADGLSIANQNGKTYYRVRAGWFAKYGAPVYEETLKAAGLAEVLTLAPGDYDFKWPVDVEIKDVNGKKQPKITKIYTS